MVVVGNAVGTYVHEYFFCEYVSESVSCSILRFFFFFCTSVFSLFLSPIVLALESYIRRVGSSG